MKASTLSATGHGLPAARNVCVRIWTQPAYVSVRCSGQIVDGHERSMAGTNCSPSCRSGDGRGV